MREVKRKVERVADQSARRTESGEAEKYAQDVFRMSKKIKRERTERLHFGIALLLIGGGERLKSAGPSGWPIFASAPNSLSAPNRE